MTPEAVAVDVTQDWGFACDVQQRFMSHPSPAIDTLNYSGRCRQVRELGGDFYDFLPLPHNRLALAIGDASGKSLPAALMVANVQSSLRTATLFAGDNVAAILDAVNRQVHASSLADRYATVFCGIFNSAMRTLRYTNAGHNPPMVIRRDGSVLFLEAGGPPVGIFADAAYVEDVVQLYPGDRLVGYTDGVMEAVDVNGEEWGLARLRQAAVLAKDMRPDQIVDAIFASLGEFSRGRQVDDATVAVAQVR